MPLWTCFFLSFAVHSIIFLLANCATVADRAGRERYQNGGGGSLVEARKPIRAPPAEKAKTRAPLRSTRWSTDGQNSVCSQWSGCKPARSTTGISRTFYLLLLIDSHGRVTTDNANVKGSRGDRTSTGPAVIPIGPIIADRRLEFFEAGSKFRS